MLCQSFTEPTDGDTCSGERIMWTCVVDSGSTAWRVTPGGEQPICRFQIGTPDIEDSCGPEWRFTSSRTEGSSDITNSSLSVTLTDDLNGTLVECIDAAVAGGNIIAFYNICVIGIEI